MHGHTQARKHTKARTHGHTQARRHTCTDMVPVPGRPCRSAAAVRWPLPPPPPEPASAAAAPAPRAPSPHTPAAGAGRGQGSGVRGNAYGGTRNIQILLRHSIPGLMSLASYMHMYLYCTYAVLCWSAVVGSTTSQLFYHFSATFTSTFSITNTE